METSKNSAMSRFATKEEAISREFMELNHVFNQLNLKFNLPDHSDVNRQRFPWSLGLLSSPEFYAARLWEYPFAIFCADLNPAMMCVDIGCGMTAFTIYLKEVVGCNVTGVDYDIFDRGIRYKGHGVSREFIHKTGITVVQCAMESLAFPPNTFDRVFCLSVIEHASREVTRRAVQEMARVLKPGGRLILTVDVNMHCELSRPLELVWESGLIPLGDIDIRWPVERFGMFFDGKQPADVFGMVLIKDDTPIASMFPVGQGQAQVSFVPRSIVPTLRRRIKHIALWREIIRRIKKAFKVLLYGRDKEEG